MNVKFLKIGALLVTILFLSTGCIFEKPVSNNPKGIVEAYMQDLKDGNYKAAVKLLNTEASQGTSQATFTKSKEKLISLYGPEAFSQIIITVASQGDKIAKVSVKLNGMKSEDLTFNLVKENNSWKIGK